MLYIYFTLVLYMLLLHRHRHRSFPPSVVQLLYSFRVCSLFFLVLWFFGAMVFRDSVESAPCLAFQGLTVPGGGSGSRGPLFWELVTCAYRMVLRFNQHIAAQSQVYNSPCAIVASFQHRESAARPFAARSVSKWLIEDQMARLEKTWRTLTVGLSLSIRP